MARLHVVISLLALVGAKPSPAVHPVMVAGRTIPEGSVIGWEMDELERLPLTEKPLLWIIGCIATREIAVGEPILAGDIRPSSADAGGCGSSSPLPQGQDSRLVGLVRAFFEPPPTPTPPTPTPPTPQHGHYGGWKQIY